MNDHKMVDSPETSGALSYLRRYEDMILAQDNEDIATIAHLRPIFLSVQQLRPSKSTHEYENRLGSQNGSQNVKKGDTSFTADHDESFQPNDSLYPQYMTNQNAGLPQLSTISSTPSKSASLSPSSDDRGDLHRIGTEDSPTISECTEAQFGLLTFTAMKHFLSTAQTRSINDTPPRSDYDILRTDAQLLMVLTTLVEARDSFAQSRLHRRTDTQKHEGISFVEFVHAYKAVICGMQVLQLLPDKKELSEGSLSVAEESHDWIYYEREQARERTLNMVRSFARPSLPFENLDTVSDAMTDSVVSVSNAINVTSEEEGRHQDDQLRDLIQNQVANEEEIVTLKEELVVEQKKFNKAEQGRKYLSFIVIICMMVAGASSSKFSGQSKAFENEGTPRSTSAVKMVQDQLDFATKTMGGMVLRAEELKSTIYEQKAALVRCESHGDDLCAESSAFKQCQEELTWIESKLKKCFKGEIGGDSLKSISTVYTDSNEIESLETRHKQVIAKRRKIFGAIGAAAVTALPKFLLVGKNFISQFIRVLAAR
jgi:hypothetical protein